MKIIFYKGEGNFFDKLVRLWTRGKYSHCELRFSDGACFSADPRTPGVRYKRIELDETKWDFVDIPIDTFEENKVRRWCNSKVGQGYDWGGLALTQILPIGLENPNRYFCSEIVIAAMQLTGRFRTLIASEYSPVKLASLFIFK